MTDIEPPETDDLFDGELADELTDEMNDAIEEDVKTAIGMAKENHARIDRMKAQSVKAAAELRVLSLVAPVPSEDLERAADIVESVAVRIDEGDLHRVRQP